MLKRLTLFIIIIILAINPVKSLEHSLTQEQIDLINEISQYNSDIKTMVGKFLQIDSSGARTEGMFYLDRPDKIRFRYAPPSREEIISIGRGFYVIDRREETKFAYPQDQIPLRIFLNEKINLLDANITEVTASEDYIAITIVDETQIGPVKVALIFEIETKDLVQWVLTEPSGAQLTFSLYDVQKNLIIPKAYFYIPAQYGAKRK
ncbi:MAG: outer membrane lipoprotein carrier protein LolA [Devosiaceae bacterium]|nr:outer membrane lipoprotein carrier protein LolA [Devosiaceae bacterium]